ncbi:MAG: hypothetical protein PHX04_01865 [Bacilli bacterium]|nr:hypothetical protein [Bacilli bacterium]
MKLEITKKELEFDEEIKRKVNIVCSFCHKKAKYINGSIRTINKTNLAYVEPHRIYIDSLVFLVFNNSESIFLSITERTKKGLVI